MSNKRKYDSSNRRKRAESTRRSIQEAARELIVQNGFDGTRISEIATRANVAEQTVYSVFGSKAAIVESLLELAEFQADEAGTVEKLTNEPSPASHIDIFVHWIGLEWFESALEAETWRDIQDVACRRIRRQPPTDPPKGTPKRDKEWRRVTTKRGRRTGEARASDGSQGAAMEHT